MTEDQIKIRTEALLDISKQMGFTKEKLLLCLHFTEQVNESPDIDMSSFEEKITWTIKYRKIMLEMGIDIELFQKFLNLQTLAEAYSIKIVLVEGKIKFRIKS